jgi:hypothetical protein
LVCGRVSRLIPWFIKGIRAPHGFDDFDEARFGYGPMTSRQRRSLISKQEAGSMLDLPSITRDDLSSLARGVVGSEILKIAG